MKFIKALLSESGSISTMRLMSLFSMVIGAGVACYGIYQGKDLGGVAQVTAVFVGGAFSAKVVQKYGESKKKDIES